MSWRRAVSVTLGAAAIVLSGAKAVPAVAAAVVVVVAAVARMADALPATGSGRGDAMREVPA